MPIVGITGNLWEPSHEYVEIKVSAYFPNPSQKLAFLHISLKPLKISWKIKGSTKFLRRFSTKTKHMGYCEKFIVYWQFYTFSVFGRDNIALKSFKLWQSWIFSFGTQINLLRSFMFQMWILIWKNLLLAQLFQMKKINNFLFVDFPTKVSFFLFSNFTHFASILTILLNHLLIHNSNFGILNFISSYVS